MKTDSDRFLYHDEKAAECVEAFKPLADAASKVLRKERKKENPMSRANEQAFPIAGWGYDKPIPGMTLREHYAGLAMQGLLAAGCDDTMTHDQLAEAAVEHTGLLIAELAKEK